MKKTILTIMASIIMVATILEAGTVTVYANGKCEYEGCDAENTPNGTVFCDKHAEQYAKEHDYKVCGRSGCWATASSKSYYCSKHTCIVGGCNYPVAGDQRKCVDHLPAYLAAQYKTPITVDYSYRGTPLTKLPPKGTSEDSSTAEATNKKDTSLKETAKTAAKYNRTLGSKSSTSKSTSKYSGSYSTKKKSSSKSSSKKYNFSEDPYDAKSYKSAQDFADDKYEEFYDYEDDYDDYDDAYEAAEDYWDDFD